MVELSIRREYNEYTSEVCSSIQSEYAVVYSVSMQ